MRRLLDLLRRWWWVLAAGVLAAAVWLLSRQRGERVELGALVEAQHESHMRVQMERWRLAREEREALQQLRAEYREQLAESRRAELRQIERLQKSPESLRGALEAHVAGLYAEGLK